MADRKISIVQLNVQQSYSPAGLASDVIAGFAKYPMELPSKYLFAIDGADIFDKITKLPEYYVTRAEDRALSAEVSQIIGQGAWAQLIELGPGSGRKTRYLLEPMLLRREVTYKPVDLSEHELRSMAEALVRDYRGLTVEGFVGDFLGAGLSIALQGTGPKLVAFLGSTLGNLTSPQRQALYERFAESAAPDDGLLVGIDLVKDSSIIEAAYNDAAGVTADFNMNVLRVLRRDLGARLDLDDFQHRAVYVTAEQRVEMRLYATRDLTITFDNEGLPGYSMAIGDYILTELSYKFTRDGLVDELSTTGLRLVGWWTDPDEQVALALAQPR